jgi:hypothetical protein
MKQAKFPLEIIVYFRRNVFSDTSGTTIYHAVEGGAANLPANLAGSEVGIYRLIKTTSFEVEKKFKS